MLIIVSHEPALRNEEGVDYQPSVQQIAWVDGPLEIQNQETTAKPLSRELTRIRGQLDSLLISKGENLPIIRWPDDPKI